MNTARLIQNLEHSLAKVGNWKSRRRRDVRTKWLTRDPTTVPPGYAVCNDVNHSDRACDVLTSRTI